METILEDIDKTWTLFLDRDGVINKKLEKDYVKKIEEFEFIEGTVEAIRKLNNIFGLALVVTNQQGIGKGIMTNADLKVVHDYMEAELLKEGAKLDKIYYCPELNSKNAICRKPNTGMAEEARRDFPTIDFKSSVMIGDSISDMQMGKRVGMVTVFISEEEHLPKEADYVCKSLAEFAEAVAS